MSKPIATSYIRDEVEVVARNQIENLQLERLRAGIGALSKILLNMPFDIAHGQFFEEYLRRQRIALASPDHQEAMQTYRERREPVFSS